MRRLIAGHRRRRSAEARFLLPRGRALRREAALLLQPGARAGSEDLRAAARAARQPLQAQQQSHEKQESVADRGGQGVHRRDPLPEIRAHGRGAVPPRGAADQREEGRPGARVLPPADQGPPELEVHPGRLPRVRRARVRQRRDGGGAEVLREGRAVPEVEASIRTPPTRRAGATSTWATTGRRWRRSSASCG